VHTEILLWHVRFSTHPSKSVTFDAPFQYTYCQENQNFPFGMRNLNDYQKHDGFEFSYGQFLPIFIEKQFCTSEKMGPRLYCIRKILECSL